jgi:DNA polymerase I-like protein with 3'-5' exonuclease and polymerase domains
MLIIGSDLEWSRHAIDVLGIAWDEGRRTTAVERTDRTMAQYLDVLRRADRIVGQNFIDADCMQLRREGINVDDIEPKVYDVRLAMHAVNGHLAGTGSYDLRSMVLLLNGRQGERFPLDFKQYESDLHRTCAMDSAAAAWIYPTLDRAITTGHLEKTLAISHACAPIFAAMKDRGVKLSKDVLEQIYKARKAKTEQTVERYHLWEERGKKVIKKVPIWRSDKILDVCQQQFGFRPKDRQRKTWQKLVGDPSLSPEARDFVDAIIDLGRGANDAHWLGDAEEDEDGGIDFSKVAADGLIHPRYDICGSPDRAIASGPNVQNFPRPGDDPRPIPLRSAVVPLDGSHVILGVDFSSVETITNAIESDDWDRVQAALDGRISHQGTADLIGGAMGLTLNRQQGKRSTTGLTRARVRITWRGPCSRRSARPGSMCCKPRGCSSGC